MNGAPGGSRQSEKAPPEGGFTRQSSVTIPVTARAQQPVISVAIFPQQHQEETSPFAANQLSTVPPSQLFSLGAGLVPQTAAILRESFPTLHSPTVQHPVGWPPQFEMQQLHSTHVATTGLRYSQPSTSQQPSPGTELNVNISPLSSLPSPAISSASLLTGIGLSSGSSSVSGSSPGSGLGTCPGLGSSAQTQLQVLSAMNPALLAQYQVILAAAAQQHHAAAAAAASIAAASGGRSSQIGPRVGPQTTSSLSVEQNIQRYFLQLHQQQLAAAAAAAAVAAAPTGTSVTASSVIPSAPQPQSTLHGSSSSHLLAQMHAALAVVGVLPSSQSSLSQVFQQAPTTAARVTTASTTTHLLSSTLGAETSSLTSRMEFMHPQPLISRVAAAARQPLLIPSAGTASSHVLATTSSQAVYHQPSVSQPYSQALGRVVMMPPPSLPRFRHGSTQERRRYIPYQRPTPSSSLTSSTSSASEPSSLSSIQMRPLPLQPYYPSHFMRGTVIRLQSGLLKRIEEMSTEDFVLSAAMKSDMILCSSVVMRIQETEKDRQVLVTFAVGEQRLQVTIEAGIEHPYFVVDQGWSSCSPERTHGYDTSVAGIGEGRGQSEPVPGTSGMQNVLRSAGSSQVSRPHLPAVVTRVERRSGVHSAPPHETRTEKFALLDLRRRLGRQAFWLVAEITQSSRYSG
ncbi:unnamed protein product [Thelazia callipaeda]|uniref:AXH domain-containing protein n=1 Tax=Thelazia callipaeda TaxID=103827 RepID=A0A0N5CP88_THECL|nr:unnamed protein product [Thelazia callipaeda]